MQERQRWACPDYPGTERGPGRFLLVDTSDHEFPECPAAHLRTSDQVAQIRVRRGAEPYATHLIDGHTHPDTIVAPAAYEFKQGARTTATMSNKLRELVILRVSEENTMERKEDEAREEERKANAARRQ